MAEQEADMTSQAPEKNRDPYVSESATQPQIAAAPGPNGESGRPDEKRMSFLEHLVELRVRLRNAALAFLVTMIGSFIFVQHYFDWLTRPVRRGLRDAGHEMNFYAKSLTEPFWVYMKLAIVGGLLISAPFIFWSCGASSRQGSIAKSAASACSSPRRPAYALWAALPSPIPLCASRPPTT